MTNPFTSKIADLRSLIEARPKGVSAGESKGHYAILPPSGSYEADLVTKLFGQKAIPQNFNLADELIKRIRAGAIDLSPKKNSGWYDYQTYSLESLVVPAKFPESQKLRFDDSYKKELEELFKSLLALTRETHVKQLEIPSVGGMGMPEKNPGKLRINVSPNLSLEPLATYYLRRARSYNFIHGVLKETLGEANISKLHRLTATTPVAKDIGVELKEMEALFFGAALIAANETGSALEITDTDGSGSGKNSDIEFAGRWMKNIAQDPDISRDNRMMVPVFYDVARGMTKVWVVLGYVQTPIEVSFVSKPEISVFDGAGKKVDDSALDVQFTEQTGSLSYPVFAEIYVKKLLNRDEFRKLCDGYTTKSQILEALQKLR
jgi:hypothetical protein